MSKEDAKKLREATNAHLAQKFQTELGQKVLVERHVVANERMDQLREVLRDIAKDLQAEDPATREQTYLGSFSVHVYTSELLRQMTFQVLTAPDHCTYDVADAALRELNGSVMETYGHKRQKRRSGAS